MIDPIENNQRMKRFYTELAQVLAHMARLVSSPELGLTCLASELEAIENAALISDWPDSAYLRHEYDGLLPEVDAPTDLQSMVDIMAQIAEFENDWVSTVELGEFVKFASPTVEFQLDVPVNVVAQYKALVGAICS
tara:strand:+ start:826 stop:1233 length:408 start_codon:yes stop_codon:yes gene_type:complete